MLIIHTVSELCTQTFGLEHRLLAQRFYEIQRGSPIIVAWGQQYKTNEKPNVILCSYTYTYHHVVLFYFQFHVPLVWSKAAFDGSQV